MKTYKYQMHSHTFPASACGEMSPEELVEELMIGGYSGCVITNHFINGNTGINPALDWEDFVEVYAEDYRFAAEVASDYDIDIIFGIEEHVGGGLEILCYGFTPEILLEHPELSEGNYDVWHRVAQSCGALCVQSHPFRDRDYIEDPGALPLEYIDGIEVYNAANTDTDNCLAAEFAAENPSLILVSGADAHFVSTVCIAGIETQRRIRTPEELVSVLKSGEYKLLQ